MVISSQAVRLSQRETEDRRTTQTDSEIVGREAVWLNRVMLLVNHASSSDTSAMGQHRKITFSDPKRKYVLSKRSINNGSVKTLRHK